MPISFNALPTCDVRALQNGAEDGYGNPPEHHISDGEGVPCRHCLKPVAAGEPYLIVAHRPFTGVNPYTETGPIFLHADPCHASNGGSSLPETLSLPAYIVRGYDSHERIIYGTGAATPREEIESYARSLLDDERIAFVHVRSATDNCFHCRIERA